MQDFLLLLIIFAFFSCGSSVQGAGSRLAFSFARDGALPGSRWISKVSRFKTPANALLAGAVISLAFVFLVYYSPSHNVHIWFVTYPANLNALFALVSFAVSGIYLSFFLTVIGAMVARGRGWVPEGAFRLGKWAWPVLIIAATYLGLMLINVIYPSGLSSGRELFNYDWITLGVMGVIAVVGGVFFLIARPDKNVQRHLHDAQEASGAELPSSASTTT
jgi:amino acid transporter